MQVVYVAHPFGGELANLAAAKTWMCWLLRGAPHVAWVAPWITDCEVLDESTDREAALQRDLAVVKRCDAVLMLGPRCSEGMSREMMAAGRVYDLTGCLGLDDRRDLDDLGLRAYAEDDGPGPYTILQPEDIIGQIVDGRSVGIDWVRLERTYHGRTRTMRRPRWACTADELARWGT